MSFARFAGHHLDTKRSWTGTQQRQALLAEAGIMLPADIGPAGLKAGVDDVLDAAISAWTARRLTEGLAVSFPDPPVTYSDGWACAIWA